MYLAFGLLSLAVPIMAIAAFFLVLGARRRLNSIESQLREIERRFADAATAEFAAPARWLGPPVQSAAGAPEAAPQPRPPTATPVAATPSGIPAEAPEARAAQPERPSPPLPPSPPAPLPSRPGFEERFGTQWVVWAGGLALALGGIFLVQYSIERGLFGPGARVLLGALLAAALIAAGEWLRRGEQRSKLAGLPAAHIPSILTAAGTTVAYATVYAAYQLYGFLGPASAFVLLGVVALATLAAALLHGPALAVLGLVGAFVVPLLIATNQPNYWALTIYLAFVTAASFAMARARHWRWLVDITVVFGIVWMLPGIAEASGPAIAAHAAHAILGFVLAAVLVVSGLLLGPDAADGRVERISSEALAAYLLAAAMLVVAQNHDPIAFAAFAVLAAATVWIALRAESATAAVPVAAALVGFVVFDWSLEIVSIGGLVPGGPAYFSIVEPRLAANQPHLVVGAGFAALFGVGGYLAQGRSTRALAPVLWAASAAAAPLAIIVALYLRIAGFERSLPFAAAALAVAVLFSVAVDRLARRSPAPGIPTATAIFATGAVAGLALALTLALEKGWLSVAIALTVPGVAWVGLKRSLPVLRWLAVVLTVIVIGRIVWEPRIVAGDLGTTPIFNWLLWGYGVPAASFWLGGVLLRRRADDVPARVVDSAAIVFTVLLVFLEIRHFMTGGDIYSQRSGLGEVALQISAGLAMAIGLERVRMVTGNVVHNIGALAIAGIAFAAIVGRLGFINNPLFGSVDVGGRFANLILLGYALPAVLVTALGLTTRQTRPKWYRTIAAVTAVTLALLYITLEVRRLFHGPILTRGGISDAEQYVYSATWLGFGIVLLVAGIWMRSQPLRLASAAVVLATVAKVFLIDMGDLEGGFRALSFIGLGLVLVAIGWLYQRLLFPRKAPRQDGSPEPPG